MIVIYKDESDSQLLSAGSTAAGVVLARLIAQPIADNLIHPKALRDDPAPPNARWDPGTHDLMTGGIIPGWRPKSPLPVSDEIHGGIAVMSQEEWEWQKAVNAWELRRKKIREENRLRLWAEGLTLVAASSAGAAAGAVLTTSDPNLKKRAASYAALGAGGVSLVSMLFQALRNDKPERVPQWGTAGGVVGTLIAKRRKDPDEDGLG